MYHHINLSDGCGRPRTLRAKPIRNPSRTIGFFLLSRNPERTVGLSKIFTLDARSVHSVCVD